MEHTNTFLVFAVTLLLGNNPLLALEPGIAIMLLVLAFNLLGNGLRDALNVKEKI